MEMNMMDRIGCSLGIRWCSLELFQGYFRRKIGGKSCSRVLGGGCESNGRGYQILLGDCYTVTVSSESSLLEEYRRGLGMNF